MVTLWQASAKKFPHGNTFGWCDFTRPEASPQFGSWEENCDLKEFSGDRCLLFAAGAPFEDQSLSSWPLASWKMLWQTRFCRRTWETHSYGLSSNSEGLCCERSFQNQKKYAVGTGDLQQTLTSKTHWKKQQDYLKYQKRPAKICWKPWPASCSQWGSTSIWWHQSMSSRWQTSKTNNAWNVVESFLGCPTFSLNVKYH